MTEEEIKEYWRTAYCNEKHKKEELEKENAELKRDKQNLRADLRTARNNLQAKDTVYQLAMEELEYAKSHCLFHSDCPTQKENAELKKKCYKKAVKDYCELEKENAELKEKLNFSTQYYQGEKAKEQLTKAKELLKWFVWYFREGSPNLVPYKHKVAEAEQFISEVEK